MVSQSAPRKTAIAPLLAIFVTSLFLVGLLPTPLTPVTPATAQSNALQVTGDDYVTTQTKFFGTGAYAYVVLSSSSLDTSEQRDIVRDVTVTSTTTGSSAPIKIDLLETGPETGVFRGGFGFSTSASNAPGSHPFLGKIGISGATDTPGRVKVTSGDTVTVSAASQTATFTWHAATAAAVTITNAAFSSSFTEVVGTADAIIFTVVDADLNQNTGTRETYDRLLFVSTDSDPEGEFLTLTEKDADDTEFSATAQFRTTTGSDARLFVREGDQIRASLTELRNAAGRTVTTDHGPWTFKQVTAGQVLFDRPTYIGQTTAGTENGHDRAVVTVSDADPNTGSQQNTVSVTITAESDTGTVKDTKSLTLAEIPGSPVGGVATFAGTLGFSKTGACPSGVDQCLTVVDGDVVRAKYNDADRPADAPTIQDALSTWRDAKDASVILGPNAATRLLFGTGAAVNVEVIDDDSNRNRNARDQITVHAKSTTVPTSLALTLQETAINSGRFTGTLEFSTSASSSKLHVTDRDRVTVEYTDPIGADGKEKLVRANNGNYVIWRAETTATVTTDRTNYYRMGVAPNILTTVHVYVNDEDQNNPVRRDSITVQAVTSETSPKVLDITLREVGIDSGLFYGRFQFAETGTAGKLEVGAGNTKEFSIQYTEATSAGGTRSSASPTLKYWKKPTQESEAVLRFEDKKTIGGVSVTEPVTLYYVNESQSTGQTNAQREHTIRVVLYVPDGFPSPVEAKLESTLCTEGTSVGSADQHRLINLQDSNDDGALDNRFVATFKIREIDAASECESATASPQTYLGVEAGKTFTARVVLPTTGQPVLITGNVRELKAEDASFRNKALTTDVERTSGTNQPVWMRVSDYRHNQDATRREYMEQEIVRTDAPTKKTRLTLVETDVDSGVFTSSFIFTQDNTLTATQRDQGHLVEVPANLRIRISGTQGTFNSATPGYNLQGGARFNTGLSQDTIAWFPATDATLTVSKQAFGSSSFEVELVDGDGMAPRRFEKLVTEANKVQYDFGKTPYIQGSELIHIVQKVTSSSGADPRTATPSYARDPAEKLSDVNSDGVADCRDIKIDARRTVTPLGGSGETSTVMARCISVATGTGAVTFEFKNQYGLATCTENTAIGQTQTTCTADVYVPYRPKLVTSCPTPAADKTAFEYTRETGGIKLCKAHASTGLDVHLLYMPAERTITVRSHQTANSAVLEEITTTLSFDAADSSESLNKWVFSGNVPVETTAIATNKVVHVTGSRTIVDFHYLDPTQTFDGGAGSTDRNHFRTNMVSDLWRAADSAAVKIMLPDFSAEAGSPVFGPAVPVLVEDRDSDRTPSQDTMSVTVRDGKNNDASFTLTLREDGAQTGKFRGIIPVTDSAAGTNANVLDLGSSSEKIIIVSYSDPFGANGLATTRSTSKDWRPAATATVGIFTDSGFSSPATTTNLVSGNLGRLFVRVTDPDANRASGNADSVSIKVISDSDPAGETFSLTETGVNTGIFESSGLQFERSAILGNNRVFTRDFALYGDEVQVKYEDGQDTNGNRRVVNSVKTGWDELFDGTVQVALDFYIGTDVTKADELANATIVVLDGDSNTDPAKVDTIELTAANSNLGQVGSGGTILSTRKATITRLVETGANTGEFIGVTSFVEGTTGANENLATKARAKVPMENTKVWRFEFIDATPAAGGTSTTFFDDAQWFRRGYGVVDFDKSGYNTVSVDPRVRLYDADLTESTISLTVVSGTDTTGKSVTLNKVRAGYYQGPVKISTSTASDALRVSNTDTLTVRYTDATPAGVRTGTASVAVGDFEAPITRLVTTPATPDGANGWFVSQPTISFSANEAVAHTFYVLDGGAQVQFSSSFQVSEGMHKLRFWSEDLFGNVETPKEVEVNWDRTPPAQSVTGLQGKAGPGGTIVLTWDAVTSKTDPLEFGFYQIYQTDTTNKVGNATGETFTAPTASDGSHTFLVGVADTAGNVDTTKVRSVTAVSDRVAPRLDSASVSPTELFELIDADLTATVTATVNSADIADLTGVEVEVVDPFGESVTNFTLTRQGSTNVFRGTFKDFEISGDYSFHVDALDAAGNFERRTVTVRFHAIDREAPRVVVPASVEQGEALVVTVTDNDAGIASIVYALDGGTQTTVAVTGKPLSHTFSVPTGGLTLGTHSIRITVSDANGTANFATYTESFDVIEAGAGPGPGVGTEPAITALARLVEGAGTLRVRIDSASPLTALTVAFDGGAPESILTLWSLGAASTPIDIGLLAAGEHTAEISATNAKGTTTQSVTFFVMEAGVPLPPDSVIVTKGKDGKPKLTWSASPSSNVGGYLVHRAASPWKVVAVLDASKREFTDTSAADGKTYRYAVTAYGTGDQGKLAKGADPAEQLAFFDHLETKSFAVSEPDSNFWMIFWVTLIVLAVIGAVVLAYVFRDRLFPPKQEGYTGDEYPDEAAAAGPFGVEQHQLRCPNCTTRFSVTGQKPIVTTCPNCGKKGILR